MNPDRPNHTRSGVPARGLLLLAVWITLLSASGQSVSSTPRVLRFKEPGATSYLLDATPSPAAAPGAAAAQPRKPWIRATEAGDPGHLVEMGDRVVLQLEPGESLDSIIFGMNLVLSRTAAPDLYILQAAGCDEAISAAEVLSSSPGVVACHPVMRRPWRRHGEIAPAPNDTYFGDQWHLDHRDPNRNREGFDLNVRPAWAVTRGEGVIIGVGDDGVQTGHPDLSARVAQGLNYNFFRELPGGAPASDNANHGTAVSGLIAAEDDNDTGVSGVAPRAQFASWVLFGISAFGFDSFASDEQMMDMFQYASNRVAVQNHSWGNAGVIQRAIDPLSSVGVGNAVTHGREGRGVVIVRAAGNYRALLMSANDDGFANDPRVISVAAVRQDGLVCSYSSPGTCILVGAPSGDSNPDEGDPAATPDVRTTDRTGDSGYSRGTGDPANYTGFDGTSASSPQVAGVAALIVSANTNLTYRDVQHILALSARHTHLTDPAMTTNGAGFRVSHNVGFGMPDAGVAVELARGWSLSNRPAPVRITVESRTRRVIPDDALRFGIPGTAVPASLRSIQCLPSLGVHPDVPTGSRPLVDVGLANAPILQDLTGKGALIQRGDGLFSTKIEHARNAGAAFAVVVNNTGTTEIQFMGGTKFTRIPAVSISRSAGEAVRDYLTANPGAPGRLLLIPATYTLAVTNAMICTHVGVRIRTTHTRRSDVRLTLISPQGTRSVLQSINNHAEPGPVDWTYWSTHHFYEASAGDWKVEVSDERDTTVSDPAGGDRPATGAVTLVQLIVDGIPITDSDRDGLDDGWERTAFGDLRPGPRDDPDADGYTNAREQALRTNPAAPNHPFLLEGTEFEPGYWRFTWPSREGVPYSFRTGPRLDQRLAPRATVTGQFPFSEHVIQTPSGPQNYFEVTAP